jgi:germination protein M
MSRAGRLGLAVLGVAVTAAVAWLLFVGLPRWTGPAESVETEAVARAVTESPPVEPRINARLYYLSADGLRLQPSEQEVPLGATAAAQARYLVEAQLAPPPAPLVSAVPPGTTLKELFITARGEAYVDLSPEVAKNHSGGSLDEMLTVYTLVAVLTENLPSITGVQILIDGREVDTLAGHMDLRRPLMSAAEWIEQPAAPPPAGN